MEELQAEDRRLEIAMARVAVQAASVPGDTFAALWRENLTGFYRTSADSRQQAESFRSERRRLCADAKSVGFQGMGYGIVTTRCELALTRTLLDQLKPWAPWLQRRSDQRDPAPLKAPQSPSSPEAI